MSYIFLIVVYIVTTILNVALFLYKQLISSTHTYKYFCSD